MQKVEQMKTRHSSGRVVQILLICIMAVLTLQEGTLAQDNRVKQNQLRQGIRVLTKVNPSSDIVALRVYLPVGPRYESAEQSGLSNLMLRLLQAGTETRTAADIANAIDSIGAELSTDINKDYGGLVLKTTRATFDQGLDIFFDCLLHSVFPEDRLANERQTILREIKQDRDNLLNEAFRLFQKDFYGEHPYGNPALGLEETVSQLSREDVVQKYDWALSPSELIFVAVGNFDPDQLIQKIDKEFRARKISRSSRKGLPIEVDNHLAVTAENKTSIVKRQSEAENLILGYLAPAINSKDFAVMRVIDSIMGGSMNSRLFTELREKRHLAYQVGSAYPNRLGPSFFGIYMGGSAPDKHETAVQSILAEVEKLKNEPVPADELQRAKTFIKGTFIMSQETNMGQASLYGLHEVMGLGADYVEKFPTLIDAVTAEDIRRVAQEYFTTYTLTAIQPEKK